MHTSRVLGGDVGMFMLGDAFSASVSAKSKFFSTVLAR